MKIMVSACLLGRNCKYNGGNNLDAKVVAFTEGKEIIQVCPEVLAGLGIPRVPIEIVDGVLRDQAGNDKDTAVRSAIAQILEQIRDEDIECAVLKSRSPTCGPRQVYDGTFSGKLVDGAGLLAQALMDAGIRVIDAEEL